MAQTKAYRSTPTNPATHGPHPSGSELVEEIDDLLAEVDACLEENALEVVRAYVARGGE